MRFTRIVSSLAVAALAIACKSSPPADVDAYVPPMEDAGAMCGPPPAPYGTTVGRNFEPFFTPLTLCDGTTVFDFYGETEGYCETSFTVLTMAAGWCVPCQMEARMIQSLIADAYADRGVRVVQALTQDASFQPPSTTFCQQWVDTYDLRFPVVMDPSQVTSQYFPMGALPATLIVDSRGVIRHREYGVSNGLMTIRTALDELLAAP
jgi:hypothetical protein